MRAFRLTENKLTYIVLENVGGKKKFFSLRGDNCGMPQISLISTDIFTIKEKSTTVELRSTSFSLYEKFALRAAIRKKHCLIGRAKIYSTSNLKYM